MKAGDWFGASFGDDEWAVGVAVRQEFGEEGLVENFPGSSAGESVELTWFGEQVEEDFDGLPAGVDLWIVCVGELSA